MARAGGPENPRGGETTAAEVLSAGLARLEEAAGQIDRHASALQARPLLPRNPARARLVARALDAETRRVAAAANQARRAAAALFRTEILSVASTRARAAARRSFAGHDARCAARIGRTRRGLQIVVRRARYWNGRFQTPSASLFPALPAPMPGFVRVVWEDIQFHTIGSVRIPVRKVKWDVVFGGRRMNFAGVYFPHFPGWTPEPKGLVGSGEVTVDGVTLHALDSPAPEHENPVLPRRAEGPAVNFSGYMKIIYAEGIPAGCSLLWRTVWYPKWYYRAPGGDGSWRDDTPDGPAGRPRADLLASGPGYAVGPRSSVFSDFPYYSFLPGTPVCAYGVRDDLWRTWVVLVCPTGATLLGYWQWSFRQVLHQGPGGIENVTTQPGTGPAGVPAPPGGWPAAPSSGPTSWVPAGAAPAQATADYNAAFP